jgi:quinoprotein relay system zinc metallohydrolase 1
LTQALCRSLAVACAFLPVFAIGAELTLQKVALGVYAFIGAQEEIALSNRGNVINTGFIVGDDAVIVIDTGPHQAHGEAILRAISKITDKPIALAINTHPHPENVLGNSAFAGRGVPILASAETIRGMRERCEICYRNTERVLGDIMAGTKIAIPERGLERSMQIEAAGRGLKLLSFGWGHTEGDLAVLDLQTGVLFSGGLVNADRIPVLAQAKVRGWIDALERLRREPFKIIIPGHGPVSPPTKVGDTLAYLKALLATVERQYQAGKSPLDVLKTSELPAYRHWALYEPQHNLNVQHVYRELEREELER